MALTVYTSGEVEGNCETSVMLHMLKYEGFLLNRPVTPVF